MRHASSVPRPSILWTALLLAVALALAPSRVLAQTGKLTGIVTDATSGQPVEGVQVVLQGTGYGAMTQANGRYFIIALPPGNYTVIARRLGYQTQQTSTTVLIDVTREVNFQLSSSAGQIAAVRIVETTTPLIETSQTGTTTQVTAAELEALPVRSVQEALTLQAGFTEVPTVSTDLASFTSTRRNDASPLLIRGGRAGETLTLIDGIPVNNFLFGGPTLEITTKAIESISTKRGGLEAQYGNALSGVVTLATKEGGTSLAGSVEYETSRIGGAFGSRPDELRGYDFVEGFLSGPVPATADKLRFVVAGSTQQNAGQVLEFDNKIFNPFEPDTVNRDPDARDLISGWRATGFASQRDLFGKLTYLFTPTTKLAASAIDFGRESQQLPFDWMLTGYDVSAACMAAYQAKYGSSINVASTCNNLYDADRLRSDGRPIGDNRIQYVHPATITRQRDLYTVRFEQTIDRLNYKVIGGVLNQRRETCATYFSGVCIGERIADTNFNGRFVTPGVTSQDITPTEGTERVAGNDHMKTKLFRADAQLQATDHHNLAAGVFYQGHDITFREIADVGLNNIVLQPSDYAAKPWDAAAYVQDKIEYDFLTVNLGIRFDYGRAGGKFFNDPLDPTNGTTQGTVCSDPARFGLDPSIAQFTDPSTGNNLSGVAACQNAANIDTIGGVPVSVDSLTKAVAFRDDMGEASIRKAFSPRLGLNFPVTEKSSAFFNFGIYYQNPLYNNVYQGTAIGTPLEGTAAGPALANGTFVGNPQLRAEQTTSYEIGYSAEFARNMGLQIVAFSKDQSGLTGIRSGGFLKGTTDRVFDPGVTYAQTNSPNYIVLVNKDYQTVRGAEIELKRRLANHWKGRLTYAFQQATTNAAPPDLEAQQRDQEGDVEARSEIRSDIDQNHTVNGELTVQVDDQAPSFRFGNLLRNSKITVTSRLASGFPYTPTFTFTGAVRERLERNSGTAPMIFRVDLKAQKDVWVSNVRYGVFMRVVNVFDRKNCLQVYATTGNCDGGASPQARLAAGNFTGEGEESTFFDRPQFLDTRRTVNAGVRVTF